MNTTTLRLHAEKLLSAAADARDLDARARLVVMAAAYHGRAMQEELNDPTDHMLAHADRLMREATKLLAQ